MKRSVGQVSVPCFLPVRPSTTHHKAALLRETADDVILMEKLIISGQRKLNGDVHISGMKNAALPILFACALNTETCVIENVPPVSDIGTTLSILADMGVEIEYRNRNTVIINAAGFNSTVSSDNKVRKIRASSYLLGVELGRTGKTRVAYPGGCSFGVRPLDQHLKGFEIMGAEMSGDHGGISGCAPDGLHSGKIMLDIPSVGATVNLILAAVLTPGLTVIGNAAREPHIVDLAVFLNSCGAKIIGAGTSDIKIEGVERLHGCTHTIIPDMIEAGTYMAAVAGTGGRVNILNVIPKHLESIVGKLREMGVDIEEGDTYVTVSSTGELKSSQITTAAYPGFPTDMHPQFAVLLCSAQGMGTVTDKIWENRFAYVEELLKMGATVTRAGNTACFAGNQKLCGAAVEATDLRGGAAMVIAALMAEGETEIGKLNYIDRGYDDLIGKLRGLGADIRRVDVSEDADFKFGAITD